jgi:hypothetical protein
MVEETMKKHLIIRVAGLLSVLLSAFFTLGCGGGGSSGNSSGAPGQINNCTGGHFQGTWEILVKWDNGDKNFNGMYKLCQDGDDLTFYNPCNAQEEVGYGQIRGQQIVLVVRGTSAYEGTLTGSDTIIVPLTNPQGIHGRRYIIKKSNSFIAPVGQLEVQGSLDGSQINFRQNPSCATEVVQGSTVTYNIGSIAYTGYTYTLTWVNPQAPTTVKAYTIGTDARATFVAGNTAVSTNLIAIPVQTGSVSVTNYVPRYSGETSGMEGLYDFVLAGGRGTAHGSFHVPFFGQEEDPFADLP